ncbi:MAG: hypothetical protein LBM00_06310 [Deltaproteobacteria bacterium]|jgi:hypothetical protein|nr:hypothetical protein [Deltaproteobacteria bacterium]
MAMFSGNKGAKRGFFACTAWRIIWLIQGGLWMCLLLFILHYRIVEVPAMRRYLDSGLRQGFDALAGVLASRDPAWDEVNSVAGHAGGGRYTRLQGDSTFTVWKELDELPTWNAGLAKLCYDQSGKLLWVRRYVAEEEPAQVPSGVLKATEYAENKSSGEIFPVIRPWTPEGKGAP